MTLSVTTLEQRVRNHLDDDSGYEGYITADPGTGTTVAVDDGTKWLAGDVGEFQDGISSDQFLVKVVAANNLTVKRGHNGTTAAAHSINIPVKKKGRFTEAQIRYALDQTINDLWPFAWKIVTKDITPSTTTVWFDMATDVIDLISVTQLSGPSGQYVSFFGEKGSGQAVRLEKNLPSTLVTSGVGISFPNGYFHPTNTIKANYRALITTTVSNGSYSDLSDGLLADALAYGACARLVAAKDIPRTGQMTTVGDSTVTPGAILQAASWYEAKYRELRNANHKLLLLSAKPMSKW